MTEVELELTYLAKYLPEGLAGCPNKQIIDVYYPISAAHPNLRLRQNGGKYQITKKIIPDGTDSSRMIEHTIDLNPQEFAGLAASGGKRVAKRRYEYNYRGRIAEVDIFEGDLTGLVVIDFEFTNREDQQAFTMPDFCLVDVTQDELTAGGMLAGKSYAQIEDGLQQYGYKPITL